MLRLALLAPTLAVIGFFLILLRIAVPDMGIHIILLPYSLLTAVAYACNCHFGLNNFALICAMCWVAIFFFLLIG